MKPVGVVRRVNENLSFGMKKNQFMEIE